MGKITKPMQAKHKETLSPWLKDYVESACTTPLPLLPDHLAQFPSRWPFGRGDLYHWISLLNRFDSILQRFCALYELNKGPQLRDFGSDLLLNHSGDSQLGGESSWREKLPADFRIHPEGDRLLIEAVLRFTNMLLEHCGNRSIYASSGHLNDLLNSTSWPVLIATLEVSSELAQRYQASVRRLGTASRQISTALLANHYNIDLERVQQLSLPFVKTPIVGLGESIHSTIPGSASKGKDKAHVGGNKNTSALHANDLLTVSFSDDQRWLGWGDVKVVYYPGDQVHDQPLRTDTGASSLPSTPTPLRRSHTVSTQSQTAPRTRNTHGEDSYPLGPQTAGFGDEQASSDQKTFELPQSMVSATPIQDLVSLCPNDMPPTAKYEAFNRLRVAKALMGSQETRQYALAARLLAITNLAYIHNETNFVEKVLRQDVDETRRFQLVYQLAELIRPSTDGNAEVPMWLQTIALTLLEAVANFHARCQDVLSALNANVNHGVLLYVIRTAVAGMKEDDASEHGGTVTERDEWRDSLFSLTLYLSMHTRVGPEMVSAGLMEILVEMLKIRSKIAQRHHSMVVGFLDGLIWTYQNAFTAFFNANGLDAVADLVVDTVKEAQTLMNNDCGTSPELQSSAVDYKIPYYQQQTLRWLLKFIHHIMSNSYTYSGNTDRLLRNLADKSDLLASLREVMADKQSFGSVDWTNSVTILSDFINNDPTSFTIIMESGMIQTYLEAITGHPVAAELPEAHREHDQDGEEHASSATSQIVLDIDNDDDRPHPPPEQDLRQADRGPLATGILPSSEAINVAPQVLNSISLNRAGMEMVVSSRAFDRFFEIFESPEHVKCMELDSDLPNNLGGSFDELARHHPALRKSISNAVIDMVARVRYLGIEKSRTAGWGTKLFVTNASGDTVSILPDGTHNDAAGLPPSSDATVAPGDADVDMTEATQAQDAEFHKTSRVKPMTADNSFTPYVFAVSSFLMAYTSNNLLKSTFVEKGGMELLFDICESPSLAANFGDSLASRVLGQVIASLVEFSPVRGLPSLLNRAQAAIDVIGPIASKSEPVPPYFAPFLATDLSTSHANAEASRVISNGTKMMKAFLNAQTLVKIVSECFLTSRSNVLSFYPINVYDYFLRLIKTLGPLLRGVLLEEAGQLTMVPQSWSGRRNSPLEDASRGPTINSQDDRTPLPDVLGGPNLSVGANAEDTGNAQVSAQEQSNPRFQNHEVFRTLIHPMIPTTFPLFQAVGKALLPRREPNQGDLYPRPRQIEIAKALADAVLDQLRPSVAVSNPSAKDFHFWIIMIHTAHEMLIEHPQHKHPERSNFQLIMPVVLAFKEEGGFDVLNSILGVFAQSVEQGNGNSEESSKPKVAAFGLKKILDLYVILVNGKYVVEANTMVNLQRNMDRSSMVPNIYTQAVVELRAVLLPAIANLWTSSVVEKVPDQTAKRLIEILKLISLAENEPASTPKDKAPFYLLKYTDARFNWASVEPVVEELANDFDRDLVHEAVFRANGRPDAARDYCQSHNLGFAGVRNPIPSEDADTTITAGARSAQVERPSSNGTGSSDVDLMSLDDAESLSGENLGGLVDRSSQVTGESSQTRAGDENAPRASAATNVAEEATKDSPPTQFVATKEDLDKQRADLRKDLIDRCLDVIRTHPDTAIEVSELINAMVIRQQNQEMQDDVCTTLTSALSSFASDENEKKRDGRCIASYAHLLALLLQDEGFFLQNLDTLRERVDECVAFVKLPSHGVVEELPPWIPHILLVLEILLDQDERPVATQWLAPKSLDESVAQPVINMPTPLVNETQRAYLLDSLLDLLPRIGKEELVAMSVVRTLVILTRNRTLAKRVGDKKNLQRLFLMAKQLAGCGAERLKQSRLAAQIITILRHIVEDEDVLRQVMRAEIRSEFMNISRGQRAQPEVTTYLRHMTALALRAPDIFVDVTNEAVEFHKWSPREDARPPTLCLKDETQEVPVHEVPNQDDSTAPDVKPSTEPTDKNMADAPKSHSDTKRPQVENPDGVVHFLLSELVNYREVDDKEPAPSNNDTKPDSGTQSQGGEDPSAEAKDAPGADDKDKKSSKPSFKPEEHPIFIYRCFLLNCLAELLQSYTRTKVEFINFKRSAPPLSSNTPVKPRSSVLNYLIYDLLCQGSLSGTNDTIASKKKTATSAHTQKVLVALVSKTKEKPIDRTVPKFAYDDEPDLQFVRKFVLDTILKAYERAPSSGDPLETRYSRMQSLAELMNHMVGERERDQRSHSRNSDTVQARSQAQLRRLMYEKGYLERLTSSIAEVNLNFPGVKRAIKYILRVLRNLTDTAKELSHTNLLPMNPSTDNVDDDIGSTSSLSDLEDDREETPDLYRNSSLGMLEPGGGDDDESEEDEDGEDFYGDEYDDEMDYDEEEMSEDAQDNVSEDSEMGEIEGLPGDPEVVEVVMDEEDDDEEDDDSEEDDDDDAAGDNIDDDLDSADMEDVENRVEIVNEDGEPIDDDGHSGWESESDAPDDEDLEADDLDYEAEAQDAAEAMHGMPPPGGLLGNMARALMEGDEYDPGLMDEHYPGDGLDEEEEEDEDMDDEEYIFDDDYPLDNQAPPPMPALGWDGLNPDVDRNRLIVLDNNGQSRRRVLTRMHNHSPFPPGFVVGGPSGDPLGDFRSYFRHHRSSGSQPATDEGVNPLLRRHDQRQDSHPRPGQPPSIGLRVPDTLVAGAGRRGMDGPMGFLGELMDILPVMGRDGQSLHLHISGPGGPRNARDIIRGSRPDHRRENAAQEPHQAVSFAVQSTMERYDQEAKMLFANTTAEAAKLSNIINARLTPAAISREKKLIAEEAERKKRAEEERLKKEEEERREREAREAEEKAAKEKQEAEAREAAERAASEAAANNVAQGHPEPSPQTGDNGAMEGVETTEQSTAGQPQHPDAARASQPRAMAMLGDQEIDVTDLGIDPDYLAALPDEFREEVIAQTVSARRSQAREEAPTGESPAAFQEFLNALPPQLRREIEQQEAQEQRRRDNTNVRAAVSAGSRDVVGGDMDTASILLTFPPELREQVLLEQGDEIMDQLPPDMAEQARRLQHDNSVPHPVIGRGPPGTSRNVLQPPQPVSSENKIQRRTVVQMLDKAGIATLVRLMFIVQQGSIRNYLFSVFSDVCENRQNRLEVVSTILQILQEGSTNMDAVDRSFGQLSLKARRHKEKEKEAADQRTPQSLKRTLTTLSAAATTETNSETSPLLIVQQCLDLLVDLCIKNPHVPWLFLTEHETVGSTLKRTLSRKGKTKDSKAHKFAINALLTLLDRDLVMESSVVMTHLADLMNRITLPLQALERRRKEAEEEKESTSKVDQQPSHVQSTSRDAAPSQATEVAEGQDTAQDKSAATEGQSLKEAGVEAAQKKARQIQPPVIPPQNLTSVVRIFVARECSSKTFQNTISTIKNLSTVPGAKTVFGQELVRQARLLSTNIVDDLDDLLPHIEKATSGTEIQGIALAKFSPGASEQNKLLRVLTALDHLFDGKKKQNEAEIGGIDDEKQDLLLSLYHNSTFSAMWEKLSTCLTAIHERENMLNVATILLPLIESLMVVCKNTTAQDDHVQSQGGKDMVLSSPPPESRTASLFFSFTEDHRRILNELVRNNPKLMSGTFALLVKNPKVLEFDNKRNYFNRSVHSRTGQPHHGRPSYPALNLSVRRDQVFHDSFKSLYFKSGDEMKFGKLNIRFHGEEGVDAGGVTREWFQVLARQMFDPNYALFIPVSSDRTTFHPNKLSGINDEHLMFFKFIGRIIGKALYEGRLLDCFFSRAVYKRILGKSVSVKDMESFDPDYYKSLCWMLENDITDIITETFSVEDDEFGVTNVVDLIPNGRDVPVTEENKSEYVRLVVDHKLLSSVKDQMENFLKGFHDIIPAGLISIFNEQELELLISGLPDVDIDDWKSSTEYHNYNPSSPQIQWFWRALRSFDKEERAKMLQFVTGTSKVPLNGFKELEGMNGISRFNIHRDYGSTDRLPTSHTCFNQLDLPEYESYDSLRSQILKAITAGSEYFGFA